jgi:DNA-binding NtrC family response regulator
VDDNSFCLALYEQFLINKGYRNLRLFENGEDCLNHLNDLPDLVLLDHDMAGINGIELLKKIKSIDDNIPVIMISGSRNPDARINAFSHGVFEFIPKNEHDLKTLGAVLDRIMQVRKISH